MLMKTFKPKVKGTPNHAPEKEHRLSHMDAAAPLDSGAPEEGQRRYDKSYRKAQLGASQYPTEPKEGFADVSAEGPSMSGAMRGFF